MASMASSGKKRPADDGGDARAVKRSMGGSSSDSSSKNRCRHCGQATCPARQSVTSSFPPLSTAIIQGQGQDHQDGHGHSNTLQPNVRIDVNSGEKNVEVNNEGSHVKENNTITTTVSFSSYFSFSVCFSPFIHPFPPPLPIQTTWNEPISPLHDCHSSTPLFTQPQNSKVAQTINIL